MAVPPLTDGGIVKVPTLELDARIPGAGRKGCGDYAGRGHRLVVRYNAADLDPHERPVSVSGRSLPTGSTPRRRPR